MGRVEKAAMSPSARPTSAPLVAPVGKGFLESTQTSIKILWLRNPAPVDTCFILLYTSLYHYLILFIGYQSVSTYQPSFWCRISLDPQILTEGLAPPLEGARPRYQRYQIPISHRIHGAGIYANIGGILMVNVTIYGIHGSHGILK